MPRKKRGAAPEGDFRSYLEIQADNQLKGAWWRCQAHGVTCDPVILGGVTYCPHEDCTARVILVQRVKSALPSEQRWNDGPFKKKGEAS